MKSPFNKGDKTLIIGAGEIGLALGEVLQETYSVEFYDRFKKEYEQEPKEKFKVIHLCFPYTEKFESEANIYGALYCASGGIVVIHSTVKVGTTRKLGKKAINSPVVGRHPNLAPAIRTFIKHIGGIDPSSIWLARGFFALAGIRISILSSPEATEMGKILDTTYSAWNVVWMKEVKRICEESNLPFHEVYYLWGKDFNKGYTELGDA